MHHLGLGMVLFHIANVGESITAAALNRGLIGGVMTRHVLERHLFCHPRGARGIWNALLDP